MAEFPVGTKDWSKAEPSYAEQGKGPQQGNQQSPSDSAWQRPQGKALPIPHSDLGPGPILPNRTAWEPAHTQSPWPHSTLRVPEWLGPGA